MAALLQTFPSQSTTITMLQAQSSSSSILQTSSQNKSNQHANNQTHAQRNSFHGMNTGIAFSNYRGSSSVATIAPYAFTSTPDLKMPGKSITNNFLPRHDKDSVTQMPNNIGDTGNRTRYPAEVSLSTISNSGPFVANSPKQVNEIALTKNMGESNPSGSSPQSMKPTPGRYRRGQNQRTESVNSQSSSVIQFNTNDSNLQPTVSFTEFNLQMPNLPEFITNTANEEKRPMRAKDVYDVKGNRRRSTSNIFFGESSSVISTGRPHSNCRQSTSGRPASSHSPNHSTSSSSATGRPEQTHERLRSEESLLSMRSNRLRSGSAKRYEPPNVAKSPTLFSSSPEKLRDGMSAPGQPSIPPRASSTDAAKRALNPSPLSKPTAASHESSATKDSFASTVNAALQRPSNPTYAQVANSTSDSPAAAQLEALNERDGKKGKAFRLRRAFSFSSAAELLKSSVETQTNGGTVDSLKVKDETHIEAMDAEQVKIAQQQEAGGIGSGIYSGQGSMFSGSTDNISISSTASSASIMIRKMGKGMKRSTRSLAGLFRPKSVCGVPVSNTALNASEAQVSMVQVEAERETVKKSITTLHPDCTTGTEYANSRKSIVGSERERAEVLSAVKKGILKRSSIGYNKSSTLSSLPCPSGGAQLSAIKPNNESPSSTAPSTPSDERVGHRSAGSLPFVTSDYFTTPLRFQGLSKSHPGTPQSSAAKRNATFSPRIQFHDTWPSGEYDRRGEIATCNRLTPILAQQIKEELNTFKMEMEVHETSKIYTHFF
ncbi:BgTH12-03457 [Blumeria graminis f. sp. triticale]|uniref:Bgt-4114 n=3 Tax=Blumeria graminis TaxID=34373 RepID=A0A381LBU9_BLUGR|nr:Targeting subunit for Glc7p protein phosphatase [Blumeria graminis f. sp. tritici 96224]CAD6499337.1 BgTH12-03457 [Blumeria graminis f. sp. triticale]VCU39462.1 Bgt-4114 [Blumeria graminis f. sp. tritici]